MDFRYFSSRSTLPNEIGSAADACEKTGDMLLGLTILFGAVGALLVFGGTLAGLPFVALGAAFALPAAVAFAVSARRVRQVQALTRIPAAPLRRRTAAMAELRKAA